MMASTPRPFVFDISVSTSHLGGADGCAKSDTNLVLLRQTLCQSIGAFPGFPDCTLGPGGSSAPKPGSLTVEGDWPNQYAPAPYMLVLRSCGAHCPVAQVARGGKFMYRLRGISSELGTPYQSYIQPAARSPPAVAPVKTANLECMRCVHSKLAVFTKSPEVSGSKNTVCLPSLKSLIFLKISYFERFVTFTLCVCPSV